MASNKSSIQNWSGGAAITGGHWGDEGKARIAYLLAKKAQMVVRWAGGVNTGHTVEHGLGKTGKNVLHLIPEGIFYPKIQNIIGSGVLFDPEFFVETELKQLHGNGIDTSNLLIAHNASLAMPWHKLRDRSRAAVRGALEIGTTGFGIGPGYADRLDRVGLEVQDLISADFKEKLGKELNFQNKYIEMIKKILEQQIEERKLSKDEIAKYQIEDYQPFDLEKLYRQYHSYAKIIAPLVSQVYNLPFQALKSGKNVLFVGAQAALLDADQGTRPYVTSSSPGLIGINRSFGLWPIDIGLKIGVVKAYSSRVGGGPFPTELPDETGDKIRELGHEYGSSTGRPRRVGWFDGPGVRFGAKRVNKSDILALTHLDILDDFDEVKICVGYEGKDIDDYPAGDAEALAFLKPVYETLPGWKASTQRIRDYDKLPPNAKKFIKKIEQVTLQKVKIITVGAKPDANIFR